MAVPTNYWSTYGVGVPAAGTEGNREDLLDLITNLDKEKIAATFHALPKTTTNSLTHEWLIDVLAATSTGGTNEGRDFAAVALSARTRFANAVQTFRRDFAVSFDQVKLSQNGIAAGVPNEYEYQVGKKLMEVTQSMDARVVALGTAVASNVGTTAVDRLLGALRAFSASAITLSTTGAFTMADLLNIQERMFGAGARPDTLVCSHGVKVDITRTLMNESLNRVQYTQPTTGVYDLNVEYIRTDLGRLAIITDIFVPQGSASAAAEIDSNAYFIFDRSKVRLAFFRQLRHYPLNPNGDAFRGYVHGSLTLEVLHPSALGIHTQLTT